MFNKILIANRGEIACRVIRTARRMGIKTVAVYSEADADALHVNMADEAVAIGPAASAQSYLAIDKIVAACKQTGAEAVHPGYGFLSEKGPFAEALEKAGITFIGPTPAAMAAMGDKIESKKLAAKAGVSTVPGHLDSIPNDAEAVRIAKTIGYPVMIKASAGGGGKGMRIARSDAEAREGFKSAQNEARSAFADDRVFIEKYVEEPRHIEIQVLADADGDTVYLGERECSIQRRHQKVIEEAPSPFVDAAMRKAMGEQAVALAKAVKYRSAGTVEFIVDKDHNFYFLEMNTRLQVEHPVTEFVTGLDLVELMIRIAAGEKLPFKQADVRLRGWAMEARVYAEDPARGFLPSTGRLVRYRPPPEDDHTRVDTGVYEGGEISIHYDPMIAKLVVTGATRNDAIRRLRQALDAFYVRGVRHNIPFLSALAALPRFVAGKMSTNLIAEEFPSGFTGAQLDLNQTRALVAVAAAVFRRMAERNCQISGQLPGHARKLDNELVVRLGDEQHDVVIRPAEGGCDVAIDGHGLEVRSPWSPGEALFRGTVDGHPIVVQLDRDGAGWRLTHGGVARKASVLTRFAAQMLALMPAKAPPDMSRFLLSPMPGLLSQITVKVGQEIKAGEPLAVVEAMKMENVLRAERDARVKAIHAQQGASLAVDQKIMEFE
ncbi:MAG: acetyl/propionyl/methylcrotonyl-CoA carboxylase subunit alpha [Alphaproteobacteria bacterium]|nr:acetyl/propionyl/methylcrotonyl-CoA carboxylase subunit alpha [Alphaproteobacteria bacterium]